MIYFLRLEKAREQEECLRNTSHGSSAGCKLFLAMETVFSRRYSHSKQNPSISARSKIDPEADLESNDDVTLPLRGCGAPIRRGFGLAG